MSVHAIDYATGPRRREMPFTVLHMTIWLTLMSLTFIGLGCFVLPRFEGIFKDFRTDLPPLTKLVLLLSRWYRNDFGWLFLLLLPSVPKVIDRLNGDHWANEGVSRRTRILFGLFVLMGVLAFCLVIVALFSPMIPLGGGVSSPQGVGH
jgi:type II secretory pathway component PulF